MRRVIPLLLAAALGLSAAFFVACGDRNNLIPSSNADAINSKLDSVGAAAARGRCGRARAAASAAQDEAQKLPDKVDPKLRSTLDDGLRRVASQADHQCTQSTASTQSTATTHSTETTPPTTTEVPTTTTNTEPPTITTDTTPTQANPDDTGGVAPGNGNGNGVGRGNGGSQSPGN
ncbi:MAG: hypothetical protein M3Z33_03790 [Actinomycetota bacterium]|nr:hypothetical protein [Actinomycetota bacterium]